MTHRERILRALRGEAVDRLPWVPRLDLWYNAHKRAGTLPAPFAAEPQELALLDRIARGRFRLGGTEYKLARNNNENHLHGGVKGFDRAVWKAKDVSTAEAQALQTHS